MRHAQTAGVNSRGYVGRQIVKNYTILKYLMNLVYCSNCIRSLLIQSKNGTNKALRKYILCTCTWPSGSSLYQYHLYILCIFY